MAAVKADAARDLCINVLTFIRIHHPKKFALNQQPARLRPAISSVRLTASEAKSAVDGDVEGTKLARDESVRQRTADQIVCVYLGSAYAEARGYGNDRGYRDNNNRGTYVVDFAADRCGNARLTRVNAPMLSNSQ
jgi:hypothetical protein